jgi:hypothetical protein
MYSTPMSSPYLNWTSAPKHEGGTCNDIIFTALVKMMSLRYMIGGDRRFLCPPPRVQVKARTPACR